MSIKIIIKGTKKDEIDLKKSLFAGLLRILKGRWHQNKKVTKMLFIIEIVDRILENKCFGAQKRVILWEGFCYLFHIWLKFAICSVAFLAF